MMLHPAALLSCRRLPDNYGVLVMRGFTTVGMDAEYRMDPSFMLNGMPTFFTPARQYLLYYQLQHDRWAVTPTFCWIAGENIVATLSADPSCARGFAFQRKQGGLWKEFTDSGWVDRQVDVSPIHIVIAACEEARQALARAGVAAMASAADEPAEDGHVDDPPPPPPPPLSPTSDSDDEEQPQCHHRCGFVNHEGRECANRCRLEHGHKCRPHRCSGRVRFMSPPVHPHVHRPPTAVEEEQRPGPSWYRVPYIQHEAPPWAGGPRNRRRRFR